MTLEQLIRSLTPEVYHNLRRAIELGRWPDGRRLTQEQRELCMEAVLHYEELHQVALEDRVGYIDLGKKAEKSSCGTKHDHDHDHDHEDDAAQERPVKWIN